MANIELVIKIDEDDYRIMQHNIAINNPLCPLSQEEMVSKVANGVPLPKGHGRLIDADELYGDFIDGTEGYDCQTWNRLEIGDIIEDAPTIIEADTESEELNDSNYK